MSKTAAPWLNERDFTKLCKRVKERKQKGMSKTAAPWLNERDFTKLCKRVKERKQKAR